MAPTESTILNNYLLVPAQLPSIISLEDFKALFPRSQQSSPQIRALYRDLQRQRNGVVDLVSANIVEEVRHGKVIRQEIAHARTKANAQDPDPHDEMEKRLLGSWARPSGPRHTLRSIVAEMEAAAKNLQGQVDVLEKEEAELLASVQQTVGSLSDLRYGRLANPKLPEQVLDGLKNLQSICEKKT